MLDKHGNDHDICECGDYRADHPNGGACLLNGLGHGIPREEPGNFCARYKHHQDHQDSPLAPSAALQWVESAVDTANDSAVTAAWSQVVTRLVEANSLLRSALSIAERGGIQTNWLAFGDQVRNELAAEHAMLRGEWAKRHRELLARLDDESLDVPNNRRD
jgi:hypothetical protein